MGKYETKQAKLTDDGLLTDGKETRTYMENEKERARGHVFFVLSPEDDAKAKEARNKEIKEALESKKTKAQK